MEILIVETGNAGIHFKMGQDGVEFSLIGT